LYGWADAAGQDILSQAGVRSFGRAWGEYQVAGAFGRGVWQQKSQADRVGVTLDLGAMRRNGRAAVLVTRRVG
jgi:hypothetical protein